ncbi:hypothetical protein MAXJ12_32914 [Mesorhizobium alhagi CCNWXJ12-2]|uniref:Uncharacterized protein n=1 Tax=Mesorhizobium alhagi CCNWXJ12-2 TaxID=1107882 RepID=H0I285_9HYPH|nr:hypothetical protein MAXJ12_32914 [Mesorhizobium alhagi CCNWXJ12-2]
MRADLRTAMTAGCTIEAIVVRALVAVSDKVEASPTQGRRCGAAIKVEALSQIAL